MQTVALGANGLPITDVQARGFNYNVLDDKPNKTLEHDLSGGTLGLPILSKIALNGLASLTSGRDAFDPVFDFKHSVLKLDFLFLKSFERVPQELATRLRIKVCAGADRGLNVLSDLSQFGFAIPFLGIVIVFHGTCLGRNATFNTIQIAFTNDNLIQMFKNLGLYLIGANRFHRASDLLALNGTVDIIAVNGLRTVPRNAHQRPSALPAVHTARQQEHAFFGQGKSGSGSS